MKGLLLKDYYLIQSVLFTVLVSFMVVGVGISFLTSEWVLTVIATVMFGMISVTTINIDKASGWRKVSGVLPISKHTMMDSKYLLYLLISGVGFILGIGIGAAASLLKQQFDFDSMLSFLCISPAMALIAGSITIPCSFLFSEEKSMISIMLAYPITGVIFAGAVILLRNMLLACVVSTAIGIILYAVSWSIARKWIANGETGM